MRLSLAVLVALGASVPATAIRIITLTGAPVENLHAFDTVPAKDIVDTVPAKDIHWDADPAPHHRPCNKAKGYTSSPGPLGTLLSHFGLASPREENPPDHGSDADDFGEMVEVWKHHVADMMQDAENKIIPLMEGGVIRILPVTNEAGGRDMDAKNKHLEHAVWKSLEGKEGIRHVYHGHHKAHSFGGRLHRALHNLTPAESITMAFVLGTGIGSILHFIFMIFLISVRHFRCNRGARAERRAACRARRAARREGTVRLEGEEAVSEQLLVYQEGQAVQITEKVWRWNELSVP